MDPRWTVHPLQGSLGAYSDSWDALNQRLFDTHPLLRSHFVDALLKHYANGTEHLCMLQCAGVIEAMCLIRPGAPGLWTTFLPAQAPMGPALIQTPAQVEGLIRQLPGLVGELDFLCNDPDYGNLIAEGTNGANHVAHSLTMNIDLQGDFASYWANRPKKLIQNIERYRRRELADHAEPRFVQIVDPHEMDAAVSRYATLEADGWKGQHGTAVGSDERQEVFYQEIMTRFAKTQQAIAFELWFGDELVASRLAIADEGMIVMLKTTYREAYSAYAPGRLLLRLAIERAFDTHPGGKIEFYTNASHDQLAWSTGQRWIRHVSFYRNRSVQNILSTLRIGRQIIGVNQRKPDATAEHTIKVFLHPSEFTPEVRRFFVSAESISFQLGFDWYKNLVDTVFPKHPGVQVFVLYRDEVPIAALPILVSKKFLATRIESLSNYYTALYAPVVRPGLKAFDLVPLIKAVRHANPWFDSLSLAPMDPNSSVYRMLLNAMGGAGLMPFQYYSFGNWYLKVKSNWSSYLLSRTGKQRNTISRMGKKLAGDGGWLELIKVEDLERGLQAYEQVYAASWKKSEPHQAFVPGLLRTCARRGWLRLGVVWLEGKAIAAQIWIVAHGKADIYKVAYDEAYKAYSPGTLLTAMLMQHVMEVDKVSEVDYLIGDDPYKQTWMSDRRERWGIIAYNPRSPRGLVSLVREVLWRSLKPIVARLRKLRPPVSGRKPAHKPAR
nr:GNAT family N-acetyltransferase [uncultured Roseateles sp.]